MGSLVRTGLVVVASPLPADFRGTPQEFFEAFVKRLEIQSASGTNFFVVGDIEPESNQGPWLKDGTKWYVFSTTEARYVPADITDSLPNILIVSDVEPPAPGEADATIWLRTLTDRVIGWYFWNGLAWRPGGNVSASGDSASRPSNPQELEQYFDTDINSLIHWERGQWRTVSGTPGDVKFVTDTILSSALASNPGWEYFGEANQSWRGRTLAVASKDPGATPESSFVLDSGATPRDAQSLAGSETVILSSTEIEQHTHLVGGLTALNSNNDVRFYRVDNGETLVTPNTPPNYAEIQGDGAANGTKVGALPSGGAGTMFVTSRQLSLANAANYTGVAAGHANLQPTIFLWALVKT